MITKRIIPCLDVKNSQVVKGVNFKNLVNVGDTIELSKKYYLNGADELVFLDITATEQKRKTVVNLVERIAKEIFIPFTVGGGINSTEDIRSILYAGADKVSINTGTVNNPRLIYDAAKQFGSQCVVVGVDVKQIPGTKRYEVYTNSGKNSTSIDAFYWVKKVEDLGAGEILLVSMDNDGTKRGFDLDLTNAVSEMINIPVIASGGAGKVTDFLDVFKYGKADAALAGSMFHFDGYSVRDIKKELQRNGILMRLKD